MQQVATNTPLYLDWSFWAVIVASIAVILSQIPPIHVLLKRARLDLEVYSKISITHKVGNPNLQLHLVLNNIGGRKIRVKSIEIHLSRDGKDLVVLPALNYLQQQSSKENLLFTAFSLKPNDEWGHIVNFLNYFGREDEKRYQEIEGNMLADYRKNKSSTQNKDENIHEHPSALVESAQSFYNEKFIWSPGEYQMKVKVNTDNEAADLLKTYRFSVFESQTSTLSAITEYFKYGGGLWWDPNLQTAVILEISEA